MNRPTEAQAIAYALKYGCSWHGLLLSDCCCECGMIRFYRVREHTPPYALLVSRSV